MIYYTANTVITTDSLIEALKNSYNGLVTLQEEKQLEKNQVIQIVEIFKEDCDYIKSILVKNYEKAEVDKFLQLADELIEKVVNDTEEYFMDMIKRSHKEHIEELVSLSEKQENKN